MQKQSEYNKAYEERKKAKGYVWLESLFLVFINKR